MQKSLIAMLLLGQLVPGANASPCTGGEELPGVALRTFPAQTFHLGSEWHNYTIKSDGTMTLTLVMVLNGAEAQYFKRNFDLDRDGVIGASELAAARDWRLLSDPDGTFRHTALMFGGNEPSSLAVAATENNLGLGPLDGTTFRASQAIEIRFGQMDFSLPQRLDFWSKGSPNVTTVVEAPPGHFIHSISGAPAACLYNGRILVIENHHANTRVEPWTASLQVEPLADSRETPFSETVVLFVLVILAIFVRQRSW